MKYYAIKFARTGEHTSNSFYVVSNDGKTYVALDHNKEILLPESDIADVLSRFNVASVTYVGKVPSASSKLQL